MAHRMAKKKNFPSATNKEGALFISITRLCTGSFIQDIIYPLQCHQSVENTAVFLNIEKNVISFLDFF